MATPKSRLIPSAEELAKPALPTARLLPIVEKMREGGRGIPLEVRKAVLRHPSLPLDEGARAFGLGNVSLGRTIPTDSQRAEAQGWYENPRWMLDLLANDITERTRTTLLWLAVHEVARSIDNADYRFQLDKKEVFLRIVDVYYRHTSLDSARTQHREADVRGLMRVFVDGSNNRTLSESTENRIAFVVDVLEAMVQGVPTGQLPGLLQKIHAYIFNYGNSLRNFNFVTILGTPS